MTTAVKPLISKESRAEIKTWVDKFPAGQERAAVLSALHIVQQQNKGYLTVGLMEEVAEILKIDPISVQGVATFYSMYDTKPVGRNKIYICTNISCKLRGSSEIVDAFEGRLGIKMGESTADGQFCLKEFECLGACAGAPMCQVNKDYHENLTPNKVNQLIDDLEGDDE